MLESLNIAQTGELPQSDRHKPLNPRYRLKGLSQMFNEAKTRILLCYVALMTGFVALSIPIFYQLVLLSVHERVTEDLVEDREAFAAFVEQEKVDLNTVEPSKLKQLFTNFLYYRLPEDDTFLITLVDGEFHRSSPQALPQAINAHSPLMAQWQKLTVAADGMEPTNDLNIGNILYVAEPIVRDGKVLGVLVVAHTTTGEIEEAKISIGLVITVLLVVLSIALLAAWWISGRVLAPLRSLAKTARTITDSDLTQRISVTGTGELAELTRTFNDMMDRLERTFADQKAFISDIGHELRTPITVVQGHLELMGDDPQEQQETLALVLDELERMTRMVNDLSLLAKTERPDFLQLEDIELSTLMTDVYPKITHLATRHWHLVVPPSATLRGDRQRLTQALMNLTENAIQHTTEADHIEFGANLSKHQISLWVKDTGAGISPKEQEKIFERFVQGEKNQRHAMGSGLGLSIVKAIAEGHGGTVEVVSQPNIGSKFIVTLPLISKQND